MDYINFLICTPQEEAEIKLDDLAVICSYPLVGTFITQYINKETKTLYSHWENKSGSGWMIGIGVIPHE